MTQKLLLQNYPVKEKRVLLRVDFNVPLNSKGEIEDDTRIKAAIPTIEHLLKNHCKIILMSHMGSPKGQIDQKFSLNIVADKLSTLLKQPVYFSKDCIGEETINQCLNLKDGQIILLENLRFHAAEEKPELDPTFAASLAKLGQCYVDDAFACAHRDHSSITKICSYFKSNAAAGLLMQKEVSALSKILLNPKKPFLAVLGGFKVSSKIGVIRSLLNKVDALFIGGGMATVFLKAAGVNVGASPVDPTCLQEAIEIIALSKQKNITLHLPKDLVISKSVAEPIEIKCIAIKDGVPNDFYVVDVGKTTISNWIESLKTAGTVFWNGPIGIFEIEAFSQGTFDLARAISKLSCQTIAGGGDSVFAINQLHLSNKFSHVSTGGGASLEFIEFGTLPGLESLTNA
jgi:phosphoglycerate kinase